MKYGYIPLEDHIDDAFHKNEQVSRTLEYAFDDAMLGEMAQLLGRRRMRSYSKSVERTGAM